MNLQFSAVRVTFDIYLLRINLTSKKLFAELTVVPYFIFLN
jgi:hypothetical protein